MKKMPLVIFEGAIGVGKTTTTKYFAEKFDLPYEEEKVDTPLLDMFYKEPQRWSFAIQIHFLNTRFKDIKKLYHHEVALLDRSIYCDRLFARINAEMERMTKDELELYETLFDNMMEDLSDALPSKKPDLMVYLKADFETVFGRMMGRARKEEMESLKENYEYFKFLHSRYDDFILNEYDASPVLVVDTTNVNIHDEKERLKVFSEIESKLFELGIF